MPEPIYRIPPYQIVSRPLTANELTEKLDWGLLAQGVPEVWTRSKGEGVRVGICDTGASNHPDLPEPSFTHNMTSSSSPADRQGHSTHVAGIISARANGQGVVGVAPRCEIGYCKVLGDSGSGYSSWIANGIRKCLDEGCNIINLSLGGGYDQETQTACREAMDQGVIVVAAAGNSGYHGRESVDYPGKLDETICVAAYNKAGNISNFSSGGKAVDIACPGEDILSTWPGGQYRALSGTSMATPFFCGLLALVMSHDNTEDIPLPTVQEVRHILGLHSEDRGPEGRDVRWGWGTPDLGGLLDEVSDEEREQSYNFWL